MKTQGFVFALAFLANVGHCIAKDPIPNSTKVVQSKPVAEIVETTTPHKTVEENQQEQIFNSCLIDSECINLSFSNDRMPDTTNFNVIEYYIKNVMPLIKKVNSRSFEMIEIL